MHKGNDRRRQMLHAVQHLTASQVAAIRWVSSCCQLLQRLQRIVSPAIGIERLPDPFAQQAALPADPDGWDRLPISARNAATASRAVAR